MILLTAGALTDPQLPARASNVYTTDAMAGWQWPGGIDRVESAGCPPNKNPGFAGATSSRSGHSSDSMFPAYRVNAYDLRPTVSFLVAVVLVV